MSRFATKELKRIVIGVSDTDPTQEEWVEIPKSLPYKEVLKLREVGSDDTAVAKFMILSCLKNWNLKDDNGQDVPVTEENILNLEPSTAIAITREINNLYLSINKEDKKKLETSN